MTAYETCFETTSTKRAPWHVIPADDEKNARLIVSQVILETLDGLKWRYPQMSADQKEELKAFGKQLAK